jgi:hypothetical protein
MAVSLGERQALKSPRTSSMLKAGIITLGTLGMVTRAIAF